MSAASTASAARCERTLGSPASDRRQLVRRRARRPGGRRRAAPSRSRSRCRRPGSRAGRRRSPCRPGRGRRPSGLRNRSALATTWAATWCGLRSLTSRAVRISRASSGAAPTMNHGSTAMQCPPTPGPGVRMLTRGWWLASRMTSQTSSRELLADQRQLVGEGDVDVAVGVLDQLGHLRAGGVGEHHLALAEDLVDRGRLLRAPARDPADDPVVGDHLDHDPAGQHPLGAVRHVVRRAPPPRRAGATRSGRSSAIQRLTCSVVPGGDVDSSTITSPPRRRGAICSTALRT